MFNVLRALALLLIGGACFGQSFVSRPTGYATGPCDLVTCAEAYSLTRSMTTAYGGPLFQLYNGSGTLDVGQTVYRVVNMATWSAFCGGTASNCKVTKIYAQIQGHANDLIASNLPGAGVRACSVGGVGVCAAVFQIDSTTGWPVINTPASQPKAQEYTLLNDAAATGINSGTNPLSVMAVTNFQQLATCCGFFGMAHFYSDADTEGTDFEIGWTYGTAGMFQCSSSTAYCIGLDEEEAGESAAYANAFNGANLIEVATWDGSALVTMAANNNQLISKAPMAPSLIPGTHIHFGAGGDLSTVPTFFREGLITNTALSTSQQTSIVNNMKAFYGALSFP